MSVRATLNWDVPLVGHPAMGSGEVGALVTKPENWSKVYILGFRNCSIGPDGKLPPRSQEVVDSVKGKINLHDTTLWWVLSGVDAINVIAKAVAESGGTTPEAIIGYLHTVTNYPGLYADYSW